MRKTPQIKAISGKHGNLLAEFRHPLPNNRNLVNPSRNQSRAPPLRPNLPSFFLLVPVSHHLPEPVPEDTHGGGGWNQEQKPGCGQHREEEEGTRLLTCPKGFGHQPGQIAGDFGPREVIVVKGFDGWNNERPSHLPRVCSIPHLSRRLVGVEGRRSSHGVAERGVQIVRAGRGPPGRRAPKSSAVLVASSPPPRPRA